MAMPLQIQSHIKATTNCTRVPIISGYLCPGLPFWASRRTNAITTNERTNRRILPQSFKSITKLSLDIFTELPLDQSKSVGCPRDFALHLLTILQIIVGNLAEIAAEILAESLTDAFLLVSTSHLSPGVDLHFSIGVDLFFGQSPSSPFTKFSVVRLGKFSQMFGDLVRNLGGIRTNNRSQIRSSSPKLLVLYCLELFAAD